METAKGGKMYDQVLIQILLFNAEMRRAEGLCKNIKYTVQLEIKNGKTILVKSIKQEANM